MKLAVLADIHGNIHALQRVADHITRWQPDAVIVAGDIVNRGPRPLECLTFVQARQREDGWLVVRGNHEDYVINCTDPEAVTSGPLYEIFQSAYWSYDQLHQDISALQAMPFEINLTDPIGDEVRVVHASMRGNRDGIFPKTSSAMLRQKISAPDRTWPALLCVGHTHVPLIRRLDGTLVVNVGAVGMPFDNDPRAAYGQLTWQTGGWSAKIIRLEYDREQTERDFIHTGFLDEAGPLAQLMLDELHTAQSRLYQWSMTYQPLTISGDLTVQEAVTHFLIDIHGSLPPWIKERLKQSFSRD